ncbi:hypothetical protein CMK11_01700 [Candidatus Poribacteria bacterium]|nr:hypothetical protein [Candidatus Poribacteria bacterium]
MPFLDKLTLLRHLLERYDLSTASVLDAGSGRSSARALLEQNPAAATFVCAPDDDLKAGHVREELAGTSASDASLEQADLRDRSLFAEASFGFAVADYLVSGLEWGAQYAVLANLYRWLAPGGDLVVVDIEPPGHATEESWAAGALLFWSRFLKAYPDRALVEPTYYPQRAAVDWLDGLGFVDAREEMHPKYFDRTWALDCYGQATKFLRRVGTEALRVGVEAELQVLRDRVMNSRAYDTPGIHWTSNYVIHVRKPW